MKIGFIDLSSRNSGEVYIFTGRNGGYELESSAAYSGDAGSALSGIPGVGEFYLSLPVELLGFRTLKLPFSEREKLLKVIPFELEGLILENPDDIVFDAAVLGGSGDQFEVLVTYIEKGVLRDILAGLALQHIDPPVVTSLELRDIVAGDRKEIGLRLVNPEILGREKRIDAAKSELAAETLNLRRGPFAYTKDVEKVKKKIRVTAALLLALALAVNAFLAFGIFAAKQESSSIKKELRNIYSGLFPGEKKVTDELYQMKSHMKEMKEKSDALIGVYPLQILLDISRKTLPGVAFNEVSMDKDLITMKGEASSMADVDKIKARLGEVLADISVSDIKPIASGKVFFSMAAKGRKR